MRQSCFIASQRGRAILVAEWPYTDWSIMAIKGKTFSSWMYFLKQFPNPWVSLQKMQLFRTFIIYFPVIFKSFSIFLIKFVMQVT